MHGWVHGHGLIPGAQPVFAPFLSDHVLVCIARVARGEAMLLYPAWLQFLDKNYWPESVYGSSSFWARQYIMPVKIPSPSAQQVVSANDLLEFKKRDPEAPV